MTALRSLLLAIPGLLVLATLPAMGQATPAVISDTVTFFQPGVPPDPSSIFEGPEGGVTFLVIHAVSAPTGNPSQFGSPTVLLEPNGNISDVFGVTRDNNFSFFSDTEAGGSVPPSFGTDTTKFIFLAEGNGGPFDATKYLSTSLVDTGVTATFQSDSEGVPEPSTLILLGSGLAGLIGRVAWRKRRLK